MRSRRLLSLFILSFVFTSAELAYGKPPDTIQYNNGNCELRTNGTAPLEVFFHKTRKEPPFRKCHFWQHRDYFASWIIADEKLYLVGIQTADKLKGDYFSWNPDTETTAINLKSIFPKAENASRIPADWYTGILLIQSGRERYEIQRGWTSTRYATNVILFIEDGRITRKTSLSAAQYRVAMEEYYTNRIHPESITGNAADFQHYIYAKHPGSFDMSDEDYFASSEQRVSLMEMMNFDNWMYTINTAKLTSSRITSSHSTLTFLGAVPICVDTDNLLINPRPELRVWGQDCSSCYVMRSIPNEFNTAPVTLGPSGPPSRYQVVLPGDTFSITRSTKEKTNTDFIKLTNIHPDFDESTLGTKLPIGKEYLIDGYITIYGNTDNDWSSLVGTDIYSSSKVRAVVEAPSEE